MSGLTYLYTHRVIALGGEPVVLGVGEWNDGEAELAE